ncbi:hypothetical protein DFH08DRAFT_1088397 [Mycena albidolilacea]|uniref:Uncharacterized protein n=1 Tax=Mycena albidolilacea TaxID=1033008 RepID=A0AAD6Z616_9AGAR|nr:hypothetical protein DFH08DRAFT_1088397 [Mycena albidolilacea]
MWCAVLGNHVVFDLPILTQQKVIVLTSVAPVRRWCYAAFLVLHYLLFLALFVTLCYYAIFSPPWIFSPWVFHGADLLLQILRRRVVVGCRGEEGRDVTLLADTHPTHPHPARDRRPAHGSAHPAARADRGRT